MSETKIVIQKILLITGKDAFENLNKIDFSQFNNKYLFHIAKISISTISFLKKNEKT